jgi:hypothetical protein
MMMVENIYRRVCVSSDIATAITFQVIFDKIINSVVAETGGSTPLIPKPPTGHDPGQIYLRNLYS